MENFDTFKFIIYKLAINTVVHINIPSNSIISEHIHQLNNCVLEKALHIYSLFRPVFISFTVAPETYFFYTYLLVGFHKCMIGSWNRCVNFHMRRKRGRCCYDFQNHINENTFNVFCQLTTNSFTENCIFIFQCIQFRHVNKSIYGNCISMNFKSKLPCLH